MKISIVTVCYNSAATIERAIQSVLSQSYPDVEYIVIDGGSADGTVDIIKKYQSKIAHFVSEKDGGIYDAMNKGIALATGDVVGILNSDDRYANDNVLSVVMAAFAPDAPAVAEAPIDAAYGNIAYFRKEIPPKFFRYWKAGAFSRAKMRNGWMAPHPAFFVRRAWYERHGNFRLDFGTAADYELLLRFMLAGIRMKYIDQTFVYMQAGGASGKNFAARRNAWRMVRESWVVNGARAPMFLIQRRLLSKLSQFLFR
jgi:glycosyltransferase involved in cell wall biosynthesis